MRAMLRRIATALSIGSQRVRSLMALMRNKSASRRTFLSGSSYCNSQEKIGRQEAPMGLMDVLNGLRNGPRGQVSSTPASGGMSPLTMGLLALLAYKASKGGGIFGGGAAPSSPSPSITPSSTPAPEGTSDSLGGLRNVITGGT